MNTKKPLGVQLYSVREDIDPADLLNTLERLAGMGFTHVEPYRILENTDGLRDALERSGLRATTAHAAITELDFDAVVSAAKSLGIHTIIVPWVEPGSIANRAGVEALAAAINRVACAAGRHGIRIGYHNHDFEFSRHIDGTSAWELLVSLLDDDVILELDTYWASVGGGDVFEILPRLSHRIRFLHVKNEPRDADDPPTLGVDITGRLGEIIELSRSYVTMPVVEVVVDEGDVFPLLERNAAYFAEKLNA
jgi:sugar phosphate isomerase/epimerase